MKRVKKIILLCGAMAGFCGCSNRGDDASESVPNVFVTVPVSVGGAENLTLPAMVEEARTISVGFKTAGQIRDIYVKEGQRVAEGQALAMLDTTDYALGISTLREKHRQMVIENERRARLHASGNMSDNDYENAVSGLRQLDLQLQIEENKLSYCTLKAPASGIVTDVNFEASEMVDAGTPVVELMDNSRLEVVADLPVRHFAERGRFASFSGESTMINGGVIPLKLLGITPRADNTQLYRLRLAPAASVTGLTPGMNIAVKIDCVAGGSDVFSIPLSAVFKRDGQTCVWVVNEDNSMISSRNITVDDVPVDGMVRVAGLKGNEVIVRAGVHHLAEGDKVNIITESETNPGNLI